MSSSKSAEAVEERHRLIPKKAEHMAKADLRIPTLDEFQAEIGHCLDFARRYVGWTVDELAGHLPAPKGSEKRGEKQVRAWLKGEERVQLDAVFAVKELREPFVIALAKLARMSVEETVTIRRSA